MGCTGVNKQRGTVIITEKFLSNNNTKSEICSDPRVYCPSQLYRRCQVRAVSPRGEGAGYTHFLFFFTFLLVSPSPTSGPEPHDGHIAPAVLVFSHLFLRNGTGVSRGSTSTSWNNKDAAKGEISPSSSPQRKKNGMRKKFPILFPLSSLNLSPIYTIPGFSTAV